MKVIVPIEIDMPDSITIDGERLEADVHTTAYGGLTDNLCYESEDGRTYVNVKFEDGSVYIRHNGQSYTMNFDNIENLNSYLAYGLNSDMGKSTKKSKPTTKSFSDMVKSQRAKNIHKGLGPEITADVNQLDDIAYLADACRFEMGSISDGIQEKAPSEIGFKCSVDEYKQKLLECKQLADWLVNNLEFWTFM